MLRIVGGGGIPLVRLRPKSANFDGEFEVFPASSDIKYVAFSHVWADGRGNVEENGLFKCQWHWLQDCAQQCQKRDTDLCSIYLKEMVPFWIDTFCVPKGSDQRVAELRRKAILMMPEIYRSADVILVLDSALENAGDMSILQFGMRLKFCGWSRRVWTLHEGAVAQNLMFRMAKGLVDLRSIDYQMAKARYPYRDKDGWHILRGIEEEYIHAVLQGCLMINRFAPSVKSMFFITWRELQKRATSLPNDRYLVLGIINQVSKETLLELQRSEVDKSDPEAARRAKLKSILLSTPVIP
jgi:Heterokaryon incompatibility protein (HET)